MLSFDDCTKLNKVDDELEALEDNEYSNDDNKNSGDNEVSSLSLTQGIQSDTACPEINTKPTSKFFNY